MMKSFVSAAGLAAVASAFTQPVQPPSYGALLTPDLNTPVTTGQNYQITWQPTQPADGVTVSLVLCKGPSTNCVLESSAVVEGVPAAAGSYSWSVPCGLSEGTQNTESGYGMLIIVDGTGQFQYSTQFSVKKGDTCSSSTTTTTSSSSYTTSSSSHSSSTSSSSVSGSASSYTTSSGWYGWSSTFNTTTTPAFTASSGHPTAPAVTTAPSASYTHVQPTAPSSVAATTVASPKPFTGAAVAPAAFVNVAGLMGIAGLAVLAL